MDINKYKKWDKVDFTTLPFKKVFSPFLIPSWYSNPAGPCFLSCVVLFHPYLNEHEITRKNMQKKTRDVV